MILLVNYLPVLHGSVSLLLYLVFAYLFQLYYFLYIYLKRNNYFKNIVPFENGKIRYKPMIIKVINKKKPTLI